MIANKYCLTDSIQGDIKMSMPIRSHLLLLFGVFVVMTAFAEDTFIVSRKVLMPDGTPAVGAAVTIRTYGDDEKLLQEMTTNTDNTGMVNATVKYNYPTEKSSETISNGYMIVDMPNCALSFAKLIGKNPDVQIIPSFKGSIDDTILKSKYPVKSFSDSMKDTTLKLKTDYQQKGIVLNKENQPVADAQVTVIGFVQTIKVNFGAPVISTPSMITTTAKDGTFVLRGVTAEPLSRLGMPYMSDTAPCFIVASAKVDGKVMVGENSSFVFSSRLREKNQEILLDYTTSLTGKVINSISGKPLTGVNVHVKAVESLWSYILPICTTNEQGDYTYPVITQSSDMYVLTSTSGFADGFICVGSVGGSYRGKLQPLPDKVIASNVKMRPMGPLTSLKVVDAVTGKPPVVKLSLMVNLCQGIYDRKIGLIGVSKISSLVQPDGTVASVMPLGSNEVSFYGPGYRSNAMVEVPAKDIIPVSVKRRNGILIQFNSNRPKEFPDFYPKIIDGNGKENPTSLYMDTVAPDGTWFYELRGELAGPYHLKVMKGNQELVPLTEVKPEVWPNVIEVK